jgi:hypothetical protein
VIEVARKFIATKTVDEALAQGYVVGQGFDNVDVVFGYFIACHARDEMYVAVAPKGKSALITFDLNPLCAHLSDAGQQACEDFIQGMRDSEKVKIVHPETWQVCVDAPVKRVLRIVKALKGILAAEENLEYTTQDRPALSFQVVPNDIDHLSSHHFHLWNRVMGVEPDLRVPYVAAVMADSRELSQHMLWYGDIGMSGRVKEYMKGYTQHEQLASEEAYRFASMVLVRTMGKYPDAMVAYGQWASQLSNDEWLALLDEAEAYINAIAEARQQEFDEIYASSASERDLYMNLQEALGCESNVYELMREAFGKD